MAFAKVLRNSVWVYAGYLLSSFLGYAYWLLLSRIVDPGTVGSAAATISLSAMVSAVFSMGIYIGVQRFLGIGYGKGDADLLARYFWTALLMSIALSLCAGLSLVALSFLGLEGYNFTSSQLMFAALLTFLGLGSWSGMFTALFKSTLRTKFSATASTVSALLKLCIGLGLVYAGMGLTGILLGYAISALSFDLFCLFFISRNFRMGASNPISRSAIGDIMRASVVSWIPALLSLAGQWLGILGIYSIIGGHQTGLYYVAFSIASVIYAIPSSILDLLFPVLSGMDDGRKRTMDRAIRLSLVITVPVALLMLVYPEIPLSLLGENYLAASGVLRVLLSAILLSPLLSGFSYLVYSYGKYDYVLLLGLAINAPRIVLYPFLAPARGELGVALAYVIGFITGLLACIPLSIKVGFRIPWRYPLLAMLGPLPPLLLSPFIPWQLACPLSLFSSLVIYTRSGLLRREDFGDMIFALLPQERTQKIYPRLSALLRILYGE